MLATVISNSVRLRIVAAIFLRYFSYETFSISIWVINALSDFQLDFMTIDFQDKDNFCNFIAILTNIAMSES
jgi:hypothetical protein